MKKVYIYCVCAWIILITGVFLYGRINDDLPPSSPRLVTNNNTIDEPYIGKPLMESSPEQIVDLFVQSINQADYDQAFSFLDPNYAAALYREVDDISDVVRLWDKDDLKKSEKKISNINYSPLPVELLITLKSGQTERYMLTLIQLVNSESVPQVKDWYINKVEKIS